MQKSNREHIIGEEKGRQPIVDYNGMIIGESADADTMRMEYWLAKQVGADLVKHYPNRQWLVDADIKNEVIVISCPSLSKRMGYRIHIKRETVAQLLPRTRRAAGEILERFGVSRGRVIDPASLEAFPRDVRDDAIAKDAPSCLT